MTVAPEVPLQVITPADVRASVRRAKQSLEKAASEIVWQIEREAWRTLGYSSWNAMREAEYGEAAFMVPRKDRPELVGRMRAKGLTQQEIADTAGVSVGTVNADLKFNSENDEPAPVITNARGQERPATYRKPEPDPIDPGEFCHHCGADQDGCACQPAPKPTTDPAATESVVITTACPTCHGTGKVTR